jgi:hypothetical protein
MNIFYLDTSPHLAAQYLCDKHVVKMILESAQMLSTAHRILDGDGYADSEYLYKQTHIHHPSNIWVRHSSLHYNWLFEHFAALCEEYTRRYNNIHKTARLIISLEALPRRIKSYAFSTPPQCLPDKYKGPDTIVAYRAYYLGDKRAFAEWKYSPKPEWWS